MCPALCVINVHVTGFFFIIIFEFWADLEQKFHKPKAFFNSQHDEENGGTEGFNICIFLKSLFDITNIYEVRKVKLPDA